MFTASITSLLIYKSITGNVTGIYKKKLARFNIIIQINKLYDLT